MRMLSEYDNFNHLDSMLNSLFSALDVFDRCVSVCLSVSVSVFVSVYVYVSVYVSASVSVCPSTGKRVSSTSRACRCSAAHLCLFL